MIKFSVIIPVYNVENFLQAGLDSVINQTYSNLEIICINDGSPDNSLKILEENASKDERIVIINQENSGVSCARNAGIKAATGDYIMFLDPDDTYDLTLCEKVAQKIEAENSDIIMWAHARVNNGEIVSKEIKKLLKTQKKSYLNKQDFKISLQINIWDKAFRKDFLIKNNVFFPNGIKCAEDKIFCTLAYLNKPSYSFIPEILYFYTVGRSDSVTNNNQNAIKNDIEAYNYIFGLSDVQKTPKGLRILISEHFLNGAVFYYKNTYHLNYTDDIKHFLKLIKSQYSLIDCLRIKSFRKLLFMINNRRP